MATTIPQLQAQLDTLSQDITNTLQSGANVSGPVLADLLKRQSALVKDLSALQAAGASVLRYGAGVPSNSLGSNNDLYRNISTGDEYQKVSGQYVLRLNLKGSAGYTPVKGQDYVDGEDGLDGNEIVDKTYAPTSTDNAGYKEGDQWFHTKSTTAYDRYAHLNGQWRLVFQKAEGSTTPTPSAITVTGFSPTSAAVGSNVTISGTGFTGATLVTFNGTAASFSVVNATTIATTVPAGATTGKVLVGNSSTSAQSVADFTVSVPANQIPTANAGADATLTLPTNSIALMGTGSDSDGTVTSYAWRQVTGPNNATGLPATTQNVVAGGLIAGSYQFGFKTTDNKGADSVEDFVLVTVNPAAGGGSGDTLTLASADFLHNLYDVDAGTYRKRSALAEVAFDTDATALEFAVASPMILINSGFAADCTVSIYDANRVFVTSVIPVAGAGMMQTLAATLPGTGVRRFYAVEGGNTIGASATEFVGTYIQTIKRLNGSTISKVAPVRRANRVVVSGNSISIGDGATNNSRYAWVKRLRDLLGPTWEVALTGWGAAHAGGRFPSNQLQQAEADRVALFMSGATGQRQYIDVLGTNDFGFSFNQNTAAGYKAAVWDKIHSADAAVLIKSGTPLWRGDKTSNDLGLTPADYAAAFNAQASSRSSFVSIVDCQPWLNSADFQQTPGNGQTTDLLHPSDSGHYIVATKWLAVVTGTALNPRLQPGETVQEDDPRLVYSGAWVRNDTPGPDTGAVFKGGALRYTREQGAYVDIPTDGRQIQFNCYTEAGSGVFELLCNGTIIATYTLYSETTVNNVSITSPVVAAGANTFRMRKRDVGFDNVYIDQVFVTAGNLTPTPSLAALPAITTSVMTAGTKAQDGNPTYLQLDGAGANWQTDSFGEADGGTYTYSAADSPNNTTRIAGKFTGTLYFNYFKVDSFATYKVLIDGVQVATGDQGNSSVLLHDELYISNAYPTGVHTFEIIKTGGGSLNVDYIRVA